MTTPGFDAAQARYDGAQPPEFDTTDDPGTKCLGSYPEIPGEDDAYVCEDRHLCPLCEGVVCTEHDDYADCGDGPAHEQCHKDGCYSTSCNEDRRDDALLARAGM